MTLIFVCIIIAATADPSSANLLIAQQGLWSTGSKYLAANASFQDLWPDRLDGREIDRDCAMIKFDSVHNVAPCPLGEMYVVLDTYAHAPIIDFDASGHAEMGLERPGTTFQRYLAMSPCFTFIDQICATVPQTGLVTGFVQDAFNQAIRSDKFGESHRIDAYQILRENYYQPYTTASCVFDVVEDESSKELLRFPRLSETNSDLKENREIVSIPGLTKGQIIDNVSGDKSSFRVHWIDLPQNIFLTGIPGAVVVNPQGPNGPPYNIYQCTFNAGWGSSVLMTDSVQYATITSHRMNSPRTEKDMGLSDAYGYIYSSVPDFSDISNLPYPERRISVSKDWMNFLNPIFVLGDNSTTTFISRWLSSAELPIKEGHVARMFAVLICLLSLTPTKNLDGKVFLIILRNA